MKLSMAKERLKRLLKPGIKKTPFHW